jgi:hypothetical protein
MSTPAQLLILYFLLVTASIIVSLVDWFGSGNLKKVYGQCRSVIGFPIFLLSVYFLPLLLAGEVVSPGLLDELRPLIFRPGHYTDHRKNRTDV